MICRELRTSNLLLRSAGAFLFVSRAKPLEDLSEARPFSSLFMPGVAFSILGQFAVHLASLITITSAAQQFDRSDEDKNPEGEFKPNVLNSCVYLSATSSALVSGVINI